MYDKNVLFGKPKLILKTITAKLQTVNYLKVKKVISGHPQSFKGRNFSDRNVSGEQKLSPLKTFQILRKK